MRISITVKPNARHEKVELLPDGSYRVAVNAPPTEGKANDAVIAALAKFFRVPRSHVAILHGQSGRKKLVEILSRGIA